MAKYIGIQEQIRKNNYKSILLLIGFPALILGAIYAFLYFSMSPTYHISMINRQFLDAAVYVSIGVAIWFVIAYFMHQSMINRATNAHSLSRKENKRIYNLVENLCLQEGMKMPKINIIEDPALNAFASGLNEKNYTVTLTRGIIEKLDDEELKGVIAHELMHIKNKDVRLLVISIIFVGIFSFLVQVLFRNLLYGSMSRRRNKDQGKLIIFALVIAVITYFISLLFKFALSRKREYMADAGAAEMTRNPLALAGALRKISGNSTVKSVQNDDVKEMFIHHDAKDNAAQGVGFASALSGLFATHPPVDKRIKVLEQY